MKRVVIDIPEHIYEHAVGCSEDSNDEWFVMRAIAKSTPLPEKHGRLIDADAFIEQEACCNYIDCMDVDTFNERTPTIIAAAG